MGEAEVGVGVGDREVDLGALQRAVSTVGWGYVLGGLTCGPTLVTSTGRVGVPSVLGSIVVVFGLSRLPFAGAPSELARRRLLVMVAVAVGWVGGVVTVVVPSVALVAGVVGSTASAAAVVLFLALMTRVSRWLGAAAAQRAWQRATAVVLALLGYAVAVLVLSVAVIPRLPGSSPAPGAGTVVVNGEPVAGVALVVAVALLAIGAVGLLVGLVLTILAFGETKAWTTARRPTASSPVSEDADVATNPPVHLGDPRAPSAREVDGKLVLRVDPPSTDARC